MREHELRRRVVGEMHLRRWPTIAVPGLAVQWVVLVAETDRAAEAAAIDARATSPDANDPAHRAGVAAPGVRFAWERHSEGSSLTLFAPSATIDAFVDPTRDPALAEALAWAESLPGDVLRSTRIWVAEDDAAAEAVLPRLELSRGELVSCRLGVNARFWSDFRLKPDGFGRLLIAANGADPADLTRQVQRLQELGNYRNRALLGLPVARESWPRLDEAEARLARLAGRVADSAADDDELMDELSSLSLELMAVTTAIGFRMDATEAYARLVEDRLDQLDCRALPGFASLTDFTERRFRPAVNTCRATTRRARELSVRAAELSSLLRARIETRIESQNAQLLLSMERSAARQLRLQQLVEGFSVIALGYYLLGLAKYVLSGTKHIGPHFDADLVIALLVVPTLLALWLGLRALKHRVLAEGEG